MDSSSSTSTSASASMPRNSRGTKRRGGKGCGNACGKLYVHLRGIRAIHARTRTREGKGDG